MPHINLLPWREDLRKQRNKDFGMLCFGFAVVTGIAVGSVHYGYSQQLGWQTERNQYLQAEIGKLNKKIDEIKDLDAERESLLARMKIIEELQASRPEIVHLFDELVSTLPEGVFYEKVTQRGGVLTLAGVSESNSRVSTLMRSLEDSAYLQKPSLVEIKREVKQGPAEEELRLSNFTLKVTQEGQTKEAEDAAEAAPEGGKAKGAKQKVAEEEQQQ